MPTFMRPDAKWVEGLEELCKWVNERKDRDGVVVEVGSYMGESTVILSKAFKTVIAIEPFKARDGAFGSTTENWHDELGAAELEFMEMHRARKNVILLKGFDEQFVDGFADGSLLMVYIDADHRYPSVLKNILDWEKKVRDGGFVCGHDYGNEPTPGVKWAVDEVFGKPDEVFQDYSWVVKKKFKEIKPVFAEVGVGIDETPGL